MIMVSIRKLGWSGVKTGFFLAGVLLLLWITPRDNPWLMRYITVPDDTGSNITLQVPVEFAPAFSAHHFPRHTSFRTLCLTLLGGFLLLILSARTGRTALKNLAGNPPALGAVLFAGLGLCGTLLTMKNRPPVASGDITVVLPNGMPIILYLLAGGMAAVLILKGVCPWMERLARFRLGRSLLRGLQSIGRFFCALPPRFLPAVLCLVFFAAANAASYLIFDHIPHVQDSIAQVFHGKIFALGRLTVPSHAHREFFHFTNMLNNGTVYSQYPPGHTICMMFGALIGAPWVVNPLLGALTIALFYLLGKELYDETTGKLAAVLGFISPFLLFMSSEFMAHSSALLYSTGFLLFYAVAVKRGSLTAAVLAGAAVGMALNTRPMTAVGIGLPFALHALTLCIGNFRRYAMRFAMMGLTFCAFAAALLLFNQLTNGDPFLSGYEACWGKGHNPGFGNACWGDPHTPRLGLIHLLDSLNGLNKYLFEWPIPGLLFIAVLFSTRTRNRWDVLLLGSCLSLLVIYFFYWFNDWCFGPRFMFEAMGPLVLLTARGLLRLPVLFHDTFGLETTVGKIRTVTTCTLLSMTIYAWTCNVPALVHLYSNRFWDVDHSILHALEEHPVSNAIVFVGSNYGSVYPKNSPLWNGDVIYALDLGEHNRVLMAYCPDRKYYRATSNGVEEIHE